MKIDEIRNKYVNFCNLHGVGEYVISMEKMFFLAFYYIAKKYKQSDIKTSLSYEYSEKRPKNWDSLPTGIFKDLFEFRQECPWDCWKLTQFVDEVYNAIENGFKPNMEQDVTSSKKLKNLSSETKELISDK